MSEQSDVVRFSSAASIFGSMAGAAIAIGVPWVILAHGQSLGAPTQVTFLWVGIIAGAVIAATSAFFGVVIPNQVGGYDRQHLERKSERPAAAPPG